MPGEWVLRVGGQLDRNRGSDRTAGVPRQGRHLHVGPPRHVGARVVGLPESAPPHDPFPFRALRNGALRLGAPRVGPPAARSEAAATAGGAAAATAGGAAAAT
ncbi:MAG: hypothetical protein ACRDY2_02445, partial [Acidimicrobiales bacterium]